MKFCEVEFEVQICSDCSVVQLYICCSAQLYSCTAVVLLIDCSLTAQLYSCTAVGLLIDCSLSSVWVEICSVLTSFDRNLTGNLEKSRNPLKIRPKSGFWVYLPSNTWKSVKKEVFWIILTTFINMYFHGRVTV